MVGTRSNLVEMLDMGTRKFSLEPCRLEITHHWKCQLAKKKELLIPPIWGCCGPTGGSIFTPGQKNHPAFFEGRWYTGKMARQIWAEWAVCLSSYLWKGWMVFLPRGKNWTSSRSTTTPDRWYWKFFFSGQLVLPMMCVRAYWPVLLFLVVLLCQHNIVLF